MVKGPQNKSQKLDGDNCLTFDSESGKLEDFGSWENGAKKGIHLEFCRGGQGGCRIDLAKFRAGKRIPLTNDEKNLAEERKSVRGKRKGGGLGGEGGGLGEEMRRREGV